MSMPRHAAKRDASEPEIVSALQQCGFSVVRLDTPVDLLVGFRGQNFLVECKTGTKGYGKSLNENQSQFNETWRGGKVVKLHGRDDAIGWAQNIAKGERHG